MIINSFMAHDILIKSKVISGNLTISLRKIKFSIMPFLYIEEIKII